MNIFAKNTSIALYCHEFIVPHISNCLDPDSPHSNYTTSTPSLHTNSLLNDLNDTKYASINYIGFEQRTHFDRKLSHTLTAKSKTDGCNSVINKLSTGLPWLARIRSNSHFVCHRILEFENVEIFVFMINKGYWHINMDV